MRSERKRAGISNASRSENLTRWRVCLSSISEWISSSLFMIEITDTCGRINLYFNWVNYSIYRRISLRVNCSRAIILRLNPMRNWHKSSRKFDNVIFFKPLSQWLTAKMSWNFITKVMKWGTDYCRDELRVNIFLRSKTEGTFPIIMNGTFFTRIDSLSLFPWIHFAIISFST